jgi:hypothetical protein
MVTYFSWVCFFGLIIFKWYLTNFFDMLFGSGKHPPEQQGKKDEKD